MIMMTKNQKEKIDNFIDSIPHPELKEFIEIWEIASSNIKEFDEMLKERLRLDLDAIEELKKRFPERYKEEEEEPWWVVEKRKKNNIINS